MKNPENRIQIVGKQACEAVGGRLVAGWYCFGEYDIMVICNVPNAQAMVSIRWGVVGLAGHPQIIYMLEMIYMLAETVVRSPDRSLSAVHEAQLSQHALDVNFDC